VTIPAQAAAGRLDAVVGMLLGTAAFPAFSTWFWNLGVRHYSGASAQVGRQLGKSTDSRAARDALP
jgi:hypothetical protein